MKNKDKQLKSEKLKHDYDKNISSKKIVLYIFEEGLNPKKEDFYFLNHTLTFHKNIQTMRPVQSSQIQWYLIGLKIC